MNVSLDETFDNDVAVVPPRVRECGAHLTRILQVEADASRLRALIRLDYDRIADLFGGAHRFLLAGNYSLAWHWQAQLPENSG